MSRREAGDTIVEVLIAIIIVGAVLVGAYSAANKSSQSIRVAQERTEGAKYAAAMVERLHADPATYAAGPATFCKNGTSASVATSCPADGLSGGLQYYTLVKRTGTPATYEVTTQWDSLRGVPENVVYLYRTAK